VSCSSSSRRAFSRAILEQPDRVFGAVRHGQPGQALDSVREPGDCGGRRTLTKCLAWNQVFIDTLVATSTRTRPVSGRGDRSHGDLRRSTGVERRTRRSSSRLGLPREHRDERRSLRGLHGAGRPVPVPAGGAECPIYPVARGADDDGEMTGARTSAGFVGNRGRAGRARLGATDGFSGSYPPFIGGTAIGQWRPTPSLRTMSARGWHSPRRSSCQRDPVSS